MKVETGFSADTGNNSVNLTIFILMHKEELLNTQKTIKKASENGWLRQIEINNKVEKNLQKIISSLKNS